MGSFGGRTDHHLLRMRSLRMREVVVRGWRIRSPCWWMSLFALFFRMGAMDVRLCTMCERLKEGDTLDVSGLTR
eukprot:scaffold8296_cov83-Alexandrium_tamarense.AAC.1